MRKRKDEHQNNENIKSKDELQIFSKEEFGDIRTIVINNEPYFVGKDIATSLGYKDTSDALKKHVHEDDKLTRRFADSGQNRNMIVINESGLYSLIFGSKLESAKEFKHWVTSEVLPAIRKTGGYVNNVDLMVNTYFSDVPDEQKSLVKGLLVNIEEKQKKIISLNNENDLLAQKNLEWADRPLINSLVRAYASSIGDFGKDWNNYKKELLYKHSININSRITNHINTTGKKPKTLDMIDDSELSNAISVAVSLCRENNVEIDNLLNNKTN